ncbi:hypothetical protein Hanom_Chr01g00071231 [Helianthus anomalus]
MIPATEIKTEAATNTIERVIETADPASMGAGAGAGENSTYSLATTVVEEMARTNSATIATLSAPNEAIFLEVGNLLESESENVSD